MADRERALLQGVALEPEFALLAKLPARYGLFLDIGARDGASAISFWLANKHSWIFAIEPDRGYRRSLRRVQRLVPRFEYRIWGNGGPRDDRPLDDLGLAPDFIKVGIEGSELSVLRELDETIRSCRPVIVFSAAAVPNLDEHLRELDYRIFGVSSEADRLVAYQPGASGAVFCIPRRSPQKWPLLELPEKSERAPQNTRSSHNDRSMTLLPLVSRWWWALLLGTLVAAAIGYAVVSAAPKTYQAESALLVGPVNTDVSLDASGALASTYADLVTSGKVLQAAIDETSGVRLTPSQLEDSVTALANQVTRIVTITVDHRDPATAARLANALARHLRTVSAQVESSSQTALQRLAEQPEIRALSARRHGGVMQAAKRVLGPSTAGLLTIIDPAEAPESPSRPVVPLVVLLAGVSGLVITGILILLKEARSPSSVGRRFARA